MAASSAYTQDWISARYQFKNDSAEARIYSSAQINTNSNTWNQSLINALIYGDYLEETPQQNALNNSSLHNRASVQTSIELGVESKINDRTSLYLGVGDRTVGMADVSKDLNEFILAGNKSFAGDTINADNSSFSLMRFQEFKLGLRYQSMNQTFGIEASILNGELFQEFDIKTGRLYTDPIGSELSYDLDISRARSDSARTGLLAPNGIGMSFNLFYALDAKDYRIYLGVNDIGWISWNDQSISIRYVSEEEWEATNVTLGEDAGLNINIQDSIQSFESFENKSLSRMLPALLFGGIQFEKRNYTHEIYANWRLNRAFVPWVQYRMTYQVRKELSSFIQVGAGGSGNYFVGLGTQLSFGPFQTSFALTNMEGLLFPNRTAGIGGAVQMMIQL